MRAYLVNIDDIRICACVCPNQYPFTMNPFRMDIKLYKLWITLIVNNNGNIESSFSSHFL